MITYKFIANDKTQDIKAMSLKKALIKYDGKPNDHDSYVFIAWVNKKEKECNKLVKLPYKTRKERKGKL